MSGVKGQGQTLSIVVKPCKEDKPYLIAMYNVISLLNLSVGRILQRLRCFGGIRLTSMADLVSDYPKQIQLYLCSCW